MSTNSDASRRGFDFTGHMQALCSDITQRLPELHHIDLDQVAIAFVQTRKRVLYGLQASLTPLRFEGGAREGHYRGKRVTVQPVTDVTGQREMLYILSFYLPRFLDVPFEEKMITVFHELWHISPQFDGDIRRHDGRCYAHTGSQAKYDAAMDRLAHRYLALAPPRELYGFLRCNFREIRKQFGSVYGFKLPRPKLIESPT